MTEETLFHEARSKASPQERAAFLDAACAGQPELRAAVEALLAATERPASLFRKPAVTRPLDTAGPGAPSAEGPGSVIGPYRLIEPIGEGGFGVVYMAEQKQPIRRTVALKILKPGMDTRQVITRFEVERQALAVMDHINIARVLDAGETANGRPYFVMELVKGVPITKYCDDHLLTPRERLALFAQVCQAIQHAHQKGIIHRDLKPSNVLIAAYDGRPVPKVIDFGVAKAMGQPLTERTVATGFGGIVGTLEYMSPEQAEFNALDVDTRSDIYSLGVLLYELLTGTTPLTKERIQQAAVTEVLRLIREEEPPRPSTRLSDSKDALASISAQRKLEPARLTRELRGELDWIVMKALEKDRNRRYETANSFAKDVQRYLADEPVQACPPSAGYRFRKYARKHKKVLATVGALALILVAATVISIGLASWALREGNHAEQQKQAAEANFKKALEAVDQMLTRVADVQLAHVPQMEPVRRDLLKDALRFYQEFLRERGDSSEVRFEAARAYKRVGRIQGLLGQRDDAEQAYVQAVALLQKLLDETPGDPSLRNELGDTHNALGILYHATNRWPQAEASFQRGVELLDGQYPNGSISADNRNTLARIHNSLTILYRQTGDLDKAVAAFDKCRTLLDDVLAGDPKNAKAITLLANSHSNAGLVYGAKRSTSEAEAAYVKAVDLFQQLIRDDPEDVALQSGLAKTHNNFGILYTQTHQLDKAEKQYQQSLDIHKAIFEDHPKVVEFRAQLAASYGSMASHIRRTRSAEESLELATRSIDIMESVLKQDPRYGSVRMWLFDSLMGRGYAFVRLQRGEDAAKDWRRMLEISDGLTDVRMRTHRPFALVFLGEHDRATAEIETLLTEGRTEGLNLLMFANVHSLSSASAAKDDRLPMAEREKLADKYGGRAVELLRRAQAAGFFQDPDQVARLKESKDLDAIRSRPDFEILFAELENLPEKEPMPD